MVVTLRRDLGEGLPFWRQGRMAGMVTRTLAGLTRSIRLSRGVARGHVADNVTVFVVSSA